MHFSLSSITAITLLLTIGTQGANEVKQRVVYTGSNGVTTVANGFGCADVHITGQSTQLGCVKHVFTDGFTVGVTDLGSKVATLCSISGTSGTCGPAGVAVNVDLTGGTGSVPPASGPGGTKDLTPAELSSKPIDKRESMRALGFTA